MKSKTVYLIGVGLLGLCCARNLLKNSIEVEVLESHDDVCGRARTDHVAGLQPDRGC
jgi:phytoene dehydrogenase-like protein